MEGQLFELEQLQQQLPLLEQATLKLEDLVGSSSSQLDFLESDSAKPPHSSSESLIADSLSARLEAAVESASLMAAELQSIHRQHVTTELLLQQEEAKAKQLEADLAQAKVSSKIKQHYLQLPIDQMVSDLEHLGLFLGLTQVQFVSIHNTRWTLARDWGPILLSFNLCG